MPTTAATTAQPLGLQELPNGFQVSPVLYRGAQPGPDGFRALYRLGIRTVINLRLTHSDHDEIEAAGLASDAFGYSHIKMAAWDADLSEVRRFLRIVTDPTRTPVFVHCQHGSDRTGTMVAAYRIVVQGWSHEAAIRELRDGPFGFHEVWLGLPRFLRHLDAPRLRRELGLPEPARLGPTP